MTFAARDMGLDGGHDLGPVRVAKGVQCAVPGCGVAVYKTNLTGVCRMHSHAAGFCGCAQCARGVRGGGQPLAALLGQAVPCTVPGCAGHTIRATGVCVKHLHRVGFCTCRICEGRRDVPVVRQTDAQDVAAVLAARGVAPEAVECRGVWATVLEQAIFDALVPLNNAKPYQCRADLDWIGSCDFFMVCALAGLDGQYVLRKLASELAQRRADIAAGRYHAGTRAVGVRGAAGVKRGYGAATGVHGVRGAV